MTFSFESELCLGYACNYNGVYLDYSGSVDLTEEEVQCLVNLIRENDGETDVEKLGLEEKYPDIFEKLDYAYHEAAREANYRNWLIEGYENGYFDEPDDFYEALEKDGLFKFELTPEQIEEFKEEYGLEDDEEIDEEDLEDYFADAKQEAFEEWIGEYYDSLDEDGKVDFIETYYGDVMEHGDPGDYDYTVEIPDEIIEMAEEK